MLPAPAAKYAARMPVPLPPIDWWKQNFLSANLDIANLRVMCKRFPPVFFSAGKPYPFCFAKQLLLVVHREYGGHLLHPGGSAAAFGQCPLSVLRPGEMIECPLTSLYGSRKPVDVFIIDIDRGLLAHRREPLLAIRSHPDGIPLLNGIPLMVEHRIIIALPLQVQQPVFHDMRFHERQVPAGIISKNIHCHVER